MTNRSATRRPRRPVLLDVCLRIRRSRPNAGLDKRHAYWLVPLALVVGFLAWPGPHTDHLMAAMAGVCPQRPSHAYFLDGRQLPLEARMTGIFAAFAVTAIYTSIANRGPAPMPTRRRFAALMALVAPMALDGLNATGYDLGLGALWLPNNALRLATGLLAGLAAALLFRPVCDASLWPRAGKSAGRRSPARWLGLLALLAVIWLAPVAGWPVAFYPIALLSTAGVALILFLLDLLLLVALRGQTRRLSSLAALAPYAALSSVLVCAELAALAVLRYSLLNAILP